MGQHGRWWCWWCCCCFCCCGGGGFVVCCSLLAGSLVGLVVCVVVCLPTRVGLGVGGSDGNGREGANSNWIANPTTRRKRRRRSKKKKKNKKVTVCIWTGVFLEWVCGRIFTPLPGCGQNCYFWWPPNLPWPPWWPLVLPVCLYWWPM